MDPSIRPDACSRLKFLHRQDRISLLNILGRQMICTRIRDRTEGLSCPTGMNFRRLEVLVRNEGWVSMVPTRLSLVLRPCRVIQKVV